MVNPQAAAGPSGRRSSHHSGSTRDSAATPVLAALSGSRGPGRRHKPLLSRRSAFVVWSALSHSV